MREILFRGKRKDNGEWVEGDLLKYETGETAILSGFSRYGFEATEIYLRNKVIPETVCQFTGLTDKNGRKIFEGDIIEHNHPYGGKSVHTVIWDKYGWNLSDFCATYFDYPSEAFSEGTQFMTVIGNAFNNPELLEVKQNG